MAKFALPNVPFVEARHVGGPQKPTAIVLSLSSTTSDEGAALGIAMNLHKATAPFNSYHYIVDEAQTYRCVPDDVAAYSSPHRAIDILICAQPRTEEWPLWKDTPETRVFHRTVNLVAELILAHKIKDRYLDAESETKWAQHKWRRHGGLIVRVIGTWPYEEFLSDVRAQLVVKTM